MWTLLSVNRMGQEGTPRAECVSPRLGHLKFEINKCKQEEVADKCSDLLLFTVVALSVVVLSAISSMLVAEKGNEKDQVWLSCPVWTRSRKEIHMSQLTYLL